MINSKFSLICIWNIISLLIFLYGYFPLQSKFAGRDDSDREIWPLFDGSENGSECPRLETWQSQIQQRGPMVEKLVLIIIDALRYDFVLSPDHRSNGRMPFVESIFNDNRIIAYEANVQPPTVTMPRIKAITAGIVPAFVDVVLNFASSAFLDDNVITAAKKRGRRMQYYGDDTWLKLFPDHFDRADGVNSFIVSDYIEVDNNVSRNLDTALTSIDSWDMTILHYLGLDHIGHAAGPSSPLIPTKLAEMDAVIKRIYEALKQANQSFSIIVLGDHGMTDVGSHGGASHQETTVPVLFLLPDIAGSTKANKLTQKIQQIDLAPTLAVLLGLPIPVNNLGLVLPNVIEQYQKDAESIATANNIDMLRQNAIQILQFFQRNSGNDRSKKALELFAAISEDFRTLLRSEFCNDAQMNTAIGGDYRMTEMLQIRYMHLMEDIREEMITSSITYNESALIIGLIAFLIGTLWTVWTSRCILFKPSGRRPRFLLFGCLLHSLSFASSSFIEEEHETWYYILTTYSALLLLDGISFRYRQKAFCTSWPILFVVFGGPLLLCRLIRYWNRSGIKWRHLESCTDWISSSDTVGIILIYGIGIIGCFWLACQHAQRRWDRFLVCIAFTCIAAYRIFDISQFWSTTLARIVYIVCLVFLFIRRSFIAVLLVTLLLVKPTNIPLIFFLAIMQRLFSIANASIQASLAEFICSNYYLAVAAYFALGNSNSIGHVDVSTGYVGLGAYSPVINGMLIIINLYAGPLLISTSAISNAEYRYCGDRRCVFAILTLKAVPTGLYLIIAYIQRYHLFIWSVFAPKLLYECLHMTVLSVILLLIHGLV